MLVAIKDFLWNLMWLFSEMAPYLLLGFVLAGFTHVFLSREWVLRHLGGRGLWQSVKATAMGIPLPICSCGVIPVAAELRRSGAGAGPTAAFLASTPQTGVDSIVATSGMMGGAFALVRVVVALISGVICGVLVDLFGGENSKRLFRPLGMPEPEVAMAGKRRFSAIVREAFAYGWVEIPADLRKTLTYGMLAAAAIAVMLPDSESLSLLGSPWMSYLLVSLIAVPLYVCSTGSIPIALMLLGAGFSPGAALIFLVCGPATSMVNLVTTAGFLGIRATVIYLGSLLTVAWVGAWAVDRMEWVQSSVAEMCHAHAERTIGPWGVFFAGILLVCLYGPVIRQVAHWRKDKERDAPLESRRWAVDVGGMSCRNCARKVRERLEAEAGMSAVQVDLENGRVTGLAYSLDEAQVQALVEGSGFEFRGLRLLKDA